MTENWKSIAGYDGLYEVSSIGRVRSLNYNHTGKIKVLKPRKICTGYLVVGLHKNREKKLFKVHRLVAAAFIPNPDSKPQVNHKNEIKSDNRAENLEWMTAKENCNFGTRNERISKPVIQLTKSGKLVAEFKSITEAARQTGIAHSNIVSCCRGLLKTTGGFVWSYAQ